MVCDVSVKAMHYFTRNLYIPSLIAKKIQTFRQIQLNEMETPSF